MRETIDRRRFLGVAGATLAGCAIATGADDPIPSGGARSTRRRALAPLVEAGGEEPVVDFHAHLQRGIGALELVALMDLSNISRLVLMPLYYGDSARAVNDGMGSDEQALEYGRAYPDRFVPFVGMQRPELVDRAPWTASTRFGDRLLQETEQKLASGEFFGMGELMLRFYPYTNRFGIVAPSDMDYPVYSWLMRRLADLSARYRAPMVVHAEAEPHVAEGMTKLLERHPEAIVVWAHNCGRSSATAIARMFTAHPGLHADLGGMVYSGGQTEHYGSYFPRRTPHMHLLVDEVGQVLPDMMALLRSFPDRFVIGTDIAHARVYERYFGHWPRWSSLFHQLPRDVARKLRFENAERLFRPA